MKVSISEIFNRPFGHYEKIEFFRKVLYVLLFVNALTLLPIAFDLFAYHGLIGTRGWNTNIPIYRQGSYAFINVLSHPANSSYPWVYLVFVFGQLIFLLTGIFKIWPKLSSFFVFFFTINLFMKGYLAFTGGEVLVNFMLLYLMFIHRSNSKNAMADIQNIVSHAFYWILLLQVCILYFFSGLYKLGDADWMSGHALMYISKLDAYQSPFTSLFTDHYWISAFATYLTLFYQLFFPLAVWFKKIKGPYLFFGVLFHLWIAIGMGIFTFGMIMIVAYLLFLDEKQIEKIKSIFKKKRLTESVLP